MQPARLARRKLLDDVQSGSFGSGCRSQSTPLDQENLWIPCRKKRVSVTHSHTLTPTHIQLYISIPGGSPCNSNSNIIRSEGKKKTKTHSAETRPNEFLFCRRWQGCTIGCLPMTILSLDRLIRSTSASNIFEPLKNLFVAST